ncbi:hypothetical protein ACMHYB_29220 [Sorangium sp. So ce1128]
MREHPQRRRGAHRHALDEFGLTERRVLDRFGGYLDRFGELSARGGPQEGVNPR